MIAGKAYAAGFLVAAMALTAAACSGLDDDDESGANGGQGTEAAQGTETGQGNETQKRKPRKPVRRPAVGKVTPLQGTYKATIGGGAPGNVRAGAWELRFVRQDATVKRPDGKIVPLGKPPIKVSGTTLAVRLGALCERKAAGRYRYTLSGTSLVFKRISDTCERRSGLLTAEQWNKSG
jgi:hypothetical protein